MEFTAQYHLNYNGHVSETQDKKFFGPNLFGEFFEIVSISYDPKTNKSRVGFGFYRWADN